MKNSRLFFIFGIIVIIAANALNIVTIYTQSIRLDESQLLWLTGKSLPRLFNLVAQAQGLPLYNLILHIWIVVFGSYVAAARTLSLIFFISTLLPLYRFAKESSNPAIAMLTVLFFSISPFMLWFSNSIGQFTLLALIASLNNLYFMRFVRSSGKRFGRQYALATAAGLLTHYLFLLLIAIQLAYTLFFPVDREKQTDPQASQFGLPSLLGYHIFYLVLSLIPFLAWMEYVFLFGNINLETGLKAFSPSIVPLGGVLNLLFGFQSAQTLNLLNSLWPLLLLIIFLIFTRKDPAPAANMNYFRLATYVPLAVIIAGGLITGLSIPNNITFITPALFFLLATLFMRFSGFVRIAAIIGITVISFGFIFYQNTAVSTSAKEDYKGVAQYLSARTTPYDIVTVSPPAAIFPIEYYYTGAARITTVPLWNEYGQDPIPPYSGQAFLTQLSGYKSQYLQVYVVLTAKEGYQKNIRHYLDTHYQLTGTRHFSPDIEVRSYRLRYDIGL